MLKNKTRIQDAAVAEIIGYILVFAMVVVIVTSFIAVYVPYSSNNNLSNYEGSSILSLSNAANHLSSSSVTSGSTYTASIPMGVKGSFFAPNSPTSITTQSSDPAFKMSYALSLNIQVEGHQSKTKSTFNKVIDTVNVGNLPIGIAFDPNNGIVYVADYYCQIAAISSSSEKVVGVINLPSGEHPYAITYDSASQDLLLTINGNPNELISISTSTDQIVNTLVSTATFYDIAYDQQTGAALVSFCQNGGTSVGVAVYNASNFETIQPPINYAQYSTTIPSALTYDPSNGLIYVAGGYSIWVLNGVTYQFVGRYSSPSNTYQAMSPWNMVFDSYTGVVYSTADTVSGGGGTGPLIPTYSYSYDTVYMFDSTTPTSGPINEMSSYNYPTPTGIVYDPANRYVYVADYMTNQVAIYDGTNTSSTGPIDTLQVGNGPGAGFNSMIYDSANGNVYVTNSGSGTVSVIEGNTNLSKGWTVAGKKLGLSETMNASGSISLGSSNPFSQGNVVTFSDGSVFDQSTGSIPVSDTPLPFVFNMTSGYLGLSMNMMNLILSGNNTMSSTSPITLTAVNNGIVFMSMSSGLIYTLVNGDQTVVAEVLNLHLYNFSYSITTSHLSQWDDLFYHQYNNTSASDNYINSLTNWSFSALPGIQATIVGNTLTFSASSPIILYSFYVSYSSYTVSLSS
jgi:DNA-binding beta-propeller fold protein YncE